jgi:hypothetical protein
VAPRELTEEELAVLEYLVSQSGDDRDALAAQLATAKTVGLSCKCGCPSISLQVDGRSPQASLGSGVDALANDEAGNLVLVCLLLRDGLMAELDFTDIAASSKTGAVGFPLLHTLRSVQSV